MNSYTPFQTVPPELNHALLASPAPYVLLVTFNLEQQMNSLPLEACWELDKLWKWFDAEPYLRVAIITGAGKKAFCAGMDLKEAQTLFSKPHTGSHYPPSGFAGLSRRTGRKPIIAAVNGHAHGGGFEIVLNCDLVLASSNATFSLPDVARGTAALEGGLTRLCRTLGLQRAMYIALTGAVLSAKEMVEWGVVLKVVDGERLVGEAVELAKVVARGSPDSVVVSRRGVREAWEKGVGSATREVYDGFAEGLFWGENAREGMRAFKERRAPFWKASKL